MNDIYREDIMEIYKNPMNKGTLENASVEILETNPFCGDELKLQLKIENNYVKDAKFTGAACAVATVSAALLTESIIGKSLEEAKNTTKDTHLNSIGLNLTTSRVKCATLVLEALQNAIKKYENK